VKTEKRDLDVRLLNVDLGNFRIGDQDNPRAAYKAMIDEEGGDLAELADDIITEGLSPADPIIIGPDPTDAGHYVVCDGNRRFTAIKLLENPALAHGTPVHKQFVEMAKRYEKAKIGKVSTVIFPDKESAMPWIVRRHNDMGGRGMGQWGALAKGRADAFLGKVRASMAVVNHLKAHELLPPALEAKLSGRTTNLDRVLQMPYMAAALGVTIEKNGSVSFGNDDQGKGGALLVRMVKAMAHDSFNVNKIRSAEERKDFIDTFAKYHVRASEGGGGAGRAQERATASKKSGRKAPSQDDRKHLALRGRENVLTIHEDRLNRLYGEATRITPKTLPNSSSILTRVFIELSTDHFLAKLKVPVPKKHVDKGKKTWADKGISLHEKLWAVLATLDPTGKAPALKLTRQALTDGDALHSVESLHDFLHKLSADTDPKEVKRIWKRWHPYLEQLFEKLP
jgi:hypothetical protein